MPKAGGPLSPNASRGSGAAFFAATTIKRPVIGPASDAGSVTANVTSAAAGEATPAAPIPIAQNSSADHRLRHDLSSHTRDIVDGDPWRPSNRRRHTASPALRGSHWSAAATTDFDFQTRYAGTPRSTTARPTAARPGCATSVFRTMAAAARMNSRGVNG